MTIAVLWVLSVMAGILVGAVKNRIELALVLTLLLSWVGVIIITLLPASPGGMTGPGEEE